MRQNSSVPAITASPSPGGFEIELTEPPGTTQLFSADSPAKVPVADDAPAGVYQVRVRQVSGDDRTIPGPWSTVQEIQKLPGPPTVDTATFAGVVDEVGTIHVAWSGVTSPTGFQVEVTSPFGQVQEHAEPASPADIRVAAFLDPVPPFEVRVRAVGADDRTIPGAWSPSKTVEVT